jgi:hypothetical protein
VKTDEYPEKPKNEGTDFDKCPKCGNELKVEQGWIKASTMIG